MKLSLVCFGLKISQHRFVVYPLSLLNCLDAPNQKNVRCSNFRVILMSLINTLKPQLLAKKTSWILVFTAQGRFWHLSLPALPRRAFSWRSSRGEAWGGGGARKGPRHAAGGPSRSRPGGRNMCSPPCPTSAAPALGCKHTKVMMS